MASNFWKLHVRKRVYSASGLIDNLVEYRILCAFTFCVEGTALLSSLV